MKIRNRLYLGSAISIVLVIILGVAVALSSNKIAQEAEKQRLAIGINIAISELDIVTYDYLLHHEKRTEQQWNLRYSSAMVILEKTAEEKGGLEQSIYADYAALGDLFSQVTTNYKESQRLIQEGAFQERIEAATRLEKRLVAQLLIKSQSIVSDAERLAERASADAMEAQELARNLTLILMLVLAITVTTTSLLVARSISEPLDELTKGAALIGKGDLEHKVGVKAKDELGDLATAFNQMTENLKNITASRDELDREVAERKRAEEELLKANTELTAVNDELEAFSYSVSHDLRAPLRSIDGFSQVLLEDYPDKLDEQGQHYLNRVRAASQNMGQLIDDLLNLSRLTRGDLNYEAVNLTTLAQTIAENLEETQPERQVEFVIHQGLVANGDARLLRALLENLFGNAWKFTSKHPSARIEFGVSQHGDKPAYFVRDDGTGFDMTYADKLFGAFQRLHAPSEFPGTGIGLATVKRIVHRHGGSIWAEGAVEQGATFYFSL